MKPEQTAARLEAELKANGKLHVDDVTFDEERGCIVVLGLCHVVSWREPRGDLRGRLKTVRTWLTDQDRNKFHDLYVQTVEVDGAYSDEHTYRAVVQQADACL